MSIIHFEKSGLKTVSETNPLPVTLMAGSSEFSENVNTNNATNPVRLVTGETGKTIKISSFLISSQQATQVTFKDEDGTIILGPIYVAANTPHTSAIPMVVTASKDLNFTTSSAVNITVAVTGNKI